MVYIRDEGGLEMGIFNWFNKHKKKIGIGVLAGTIFGSGLGFDGTKGITATPTPLHAAETTNRQNEIEWSHPVYKILYYSAGMYCENEKDTRALKTAIRLTNQGEGNVALYILLPNYDPHVRGLGTIKQVECEKHKNDPVYFTGLLLALMLEKKQGYYKGMLKRQNLQKDPPMPTNPLIQEYVLALVNIKKETEIMETIQNKKFTKLFNINSLYAKN